MSHDPERAYVAAMLESQRDSFDRAKAAMQADLDRLRDDWSSSFAAENERVAEQMQKAQADHRAWLQSLYDGDTDEGAHTDVAQGRQGASPAGPSSANHGGAVPGQPDPHAAKLTALDIADMSMAEYAKRRAELGVRSATSMDRLFG